MATYKQVQDYVKRKYGFTVKPCWVAHCKELNGLHPRPAPNRYNETRKVPCPPGKRALIKEAFLHFGMI